MKPRVERLEGRENPATDVGLGELFFDGHYVRPFEDWSGGLSFLETATEVWVGGQSGAGPRVAVFDRDTGERTRPDWFAGDSSSRYGVVFVDAGDEPVYVTVQIPEMTLGDTSHPDPFVVYVDWERPPSPDWVTLGMARLAADLPIAGLVFTTVRPDDWPGAYGTAVVTPHLDYADANYGESVGGLGFADWTDRTDLSVNEFVQAGYEHTTAELIGDLLAHEIAHGFGWSHGADGDFRDNLDVIAAGVAKAIAVAA